MLAAYQGGGYLRCICNNNLAIAKYAIIRYFSRVLFAFMYILSFKLLNALKTQKNGRLLYVLLQYIVTCRPVRFREAEKIYIMYIICIRKKTYAHFSHCTFPLTQILHSMIAQKKRPDLSAGR